MSSPNGALGAGLAEHRSQAGQPTAHLITVGKSSAAKRLLRVDTVWAARSPKTERDSTVQPGRSGDEERGPMLLRPGGARPPPPLSLSRGVLLGRPSPTLHPCTCTLGLASGVPGTPADQTLIASPFVHILVGPELLGPVSLGAQQEDEKNSSLLPTHVLLSYDPRRGLIPGPSHSTALPSQTG